VAERGPQVAAHALVFDQQNQQGGALSFIEWSRCRPAPRRRPRVLGRPPGERVNHLPDGRRAELAGVVWTHAHHADSPAAPTRGHTGPRFRSDRSIPAATNARMSALRFLLVHRVGRRVQGPA
jgi:hypothetical protein